MYFNFLVNIQTVFYVFLCRYTVVHLFKQIYEKHHYLKMVSSQNSSYSNNSLIRNFSLEERELSL